MHIEEDSIDDLLNRVYSVLLSATDVVPTSKGRTAECVGVVLRLKDPRARLSASETRLKLFSALGEFVWYLSGSDDPEFISHYISWYRDAKLDADGRMPGAYGPRLFGSAPYDQFNKVVKLLKERPTTRRAVIQLYRAEDLAVSLEARSADDLLEVPCTCTLQFLVRGGLLHLIVYMRSNDAYLGLPHDVFCFTMLQELAARAVGVDIGSYVHCVGSLHLYESARSAAGQYLGEGWHTTSVMPPMPTGDQMQSVSALVEAERQIRAAGDSVSIELLPPYWKDIALLLKAHSALVSASTDQYVEVLQATRDRVTCEAYKRYLLDREHAIASENAGERK
jgi:thymidylate synthase